jgi:hypothetical protein
LRAPVFLDERHADVTRAGPDCDARLQPRVDAVGARPRRREQGDPIILAADRRCEHAFVVDAEFDVMWKLQSTREAVVRAIELRRDLILAVDRNEWRSAVRRGAERQSFDVFELMAVGPGDEALGDGTVDGSPTASALILSAAARYRSSRSGDTLRASAMLSNP